MIKELSLRGKQFIKKREVLRLKAYLDSAGVPTIGWGHTRGVKLTNIITLDQAETLFLYDTAWAVDAVNAVKVDLNQNQFDALVSFVFNVGQPQFNTSTLLRYLNEGFYEKAAAQLLVWVWETDPLTKVLSLSIGLARRRLEELELFMEKI